MLHNAMTLVAQPRYWQHYLYFISPSKLMAFTLLIQIFGAKGSQVVRKITNTLRAYTWHSSFIPRNHSFQGLSSFTDIPKPLEKKPKQKTSTDVNGKSRFCSVVFCTSVLLLLVPMKQVPLNVRELRSLPMAVFFWGAQMNHKSSIIQWRDEKSNLRPNLLKISILTTWLRSHR